MIPVLIQPAGITLQFVRSWAVVKWIFRIKNKISLSSSIFQLKSNTDQIKLELDFINCYFSRGHWAWGPRGRGHWAWGPRGHGHWAWGPRGRGHFWFEKTRIEICWNFNITMYFMYKMGCKNVFHNLSMECLLFFNMHGIELLNF